MSVPPASTGNSHDRDAKATSAPESADVGISSIEKSGSNDSSRTSVTSRLPSDESLRLIETAAPRNLFLLAAYEIVLRVSWIFKTESVIIPAFLDTLTGGAGVARGLLPLLSRTGQSIVPLLIADRLRDAPRKSRSLGRSTMLMSLLFSLAALIAALRPTSLAPFLSPLFLLVYVAFFAATGVNQLVTGTVQGKLVRVDRRGRLQGISGVLGSVAAISAALLWLQQWLNWPDGSGFVPIFVFTAAGFALAALLTPLLIEPADTATSRPRLSSLQLFHSAWAIYCSDQSFRRGARVAMLLISVVLLFPHFQWLARQQYGAEHDRLVMWVVVQNIGVAVFSSLFGWLADRWGNRVTIRLQCIVVAMAPIAAITLTHPAVDPEFGRQWYWIVFLLLGVSPVAMRTISNYTLELAPPAEHPRYLSTMRICYLMPLLLAPGIGLLLDLFPATDHTKAMVVFGMVTIAISLGGVLTIWMAEPRFVNDETASIEQRLNAQNAEQDVRETP
ncbi:MAG: MFS transporter [Planctomycetaceae bacterium]